MRKTYGRRHMSDRDDNIPIPFGAWLKKRRRQLDLTQQELGQRAGCSSATVKKIEAGDLKPSKQLAETMAIALDITADRRAAFVHFARNGESEQAWDAFNAGLNAAPNAAVTASAAQAPAYNNLPAQFTELVGRERELKAIARLLHQPAIRLLTLVGTPGTGKTRLACEVASAVWQDFEHGACVVWLAGVADASDVPNAIAQALGLNLGEDAHMAEKLQLHLRDKRMLLLLDNFEHVLPAAPLVGALLGAAPGLKVMVTSREPLNMTGEREYSTLPLVLPDVNHLPDLDALAALPAVAMFIQRAQAVRPEFELSADNAGDVARICTWLDGLPLAIEMAAAQIKWSSPRELLRQISTRLSALTDARRDIAGRHKTLWAALDWSYTLLSEPEQALMRRMALFPDGSFIGGLEEICGDHEGQIQGVPVSMLAGQLVNKSLCSVMEQPQGTLYRMLEPVRQYALSHLQDDDERAVTQRRLIERLTRQMETLAAQLHGPQQREAMRFVEVRMNTIRAGLKWAAEMDHVLEARLIVATGPFWIPLGYFNEGWRYTSAALPRAQHLDDPVLRADFLCMAGELALHRRDFDVAVALAQQSLALARQHQATRIAGMALWVLGSSHYFLDYATGDLTQALAYLDESVALHRADSEMHLVARALNKLGDVLNWMGNHAPAQRVLEEALTHSTAQGDNLQRAVTLRGLADVLKQRGQYVEAAALYRESAHLAREHGERIGEGIAQANLAIIANLTGDFEASRGHAAAAHRLFESMGNRHELPYLHRLQGYGLLRTGREEDAIKHFRASLTGNRDLGDTRGVLTSVLAFAAVAVQREQWARAARLFGLVEAGLASTGGANGSGLLATDARAYDDIHAALSEPLTAMDFAALRAMGATQSLDWALVEALAMASS
jgi:predicted ATPase/transcriptional regulator with XRE-family HTH domain